MSLSFSFSAQQHNPFRGSCCSWISMRARIRRQRRSSNASKSHISLTCAYMHSATAFRFCTSSLLGHSCPKARSFFRGSGVFLAFCRQVRQRYTFQYYSSSEISSSVMLKQLNVSSLEQSTEVSCTYCECTSFGYRCWYTFDPTVTIANSTSSKSQ